MPVALSAPTNVVVCQWPCGTGATQRCPLPRQNRCQLHPPAAVEREAVPFVKQQLGRAVRVRHPSGAVEQQRRPWHHVKNGRKVLRAARNATHRHGGVERASEMRCQPLESRERMIGPVRAARR